MNVKSFIKQHLEDGLAPIYLHIEDESHMHNVPAGAQSHFKVTVVSEAFVGQRLISRHRTVNQLLAEALQGPVHALALHTFTLSEWEKRGGSVIASPACRGGEERL